MVGFCSVSGNLSQLQMDTDEPYSVTPQYYYVWCVLFCRFSATHVQSCTIQIESMGRKDFRPLVSGRSLVVSSVTSIFRFFSCITVLPWLGSLTDLLPFYHESALGTWELQQIALSSKTTNREYWSMTHNIPTNRFVIKAFVCSSPREPARAGFQRDSYQILQIHFYQKIMVKGAKYKTTETYCFY